MIKVGIFIKKAAHYLIKAEGVKNMIDFLAKMHNVFF